MSDSQPLHINLDLETKDNKYYRNVIYTLPNFQLVLMSVRPSQEIGMEKHKNLSQFIKVEYGRGIAIINESYYKLYKGVAICIPNNTYHNIINVHSSKDLKLYTIYSKPDHPENLIEEEKP